MYDVLAWGFLAMTAGFVVLLLFLAYENARRGDQE